MAKNESKHVEHRSMQKEYLVAPNRIAFQKNDLFGIKDKQGNIIVKPRYSQMSSIGENIGFVRIKDKNEKCGIIYAEDGKPFIPCKYKYIIYKRQTDTYKVMTLKGKCGLLDHAAKSIIPARYDALDVTEIAKGRQRRTNPPISEPHAWKRDDEMKKRNNGDKNVAKMQKICRIQSDINKRSHLLIQDRISGKQTKVGAMRGEREKKFKEKCARACVYAKKAVNLQPNLTKSSFTYHEKSRKDSIVDRGIAGSDRGSIVLECRHCGLEIGSEKSKASL